MTSWKQKYEELDEETAELRDVMENVTEISASHHIPVEWIEYPNARIGIDGNGMVSEIQFTNPLEAAMVIW